LVKSDQTIKRIINFSYSKTYGDAVSSAEIVLKRTNTTEDLADFIPGKPIQIWMSDTLVTGQVAETSANIIFDGYIEDPDPEVYKIVLKCSDRLVLTRWSETGTKIEYDENTPLKTIFTALVARAASETGETINLSIHANATIPANLNRYLTDNNNVYEKLWELSNITNWQFYYDPTDTYVAGGCVRFEPRGTLTEQIFYNKAASTGTPKDQNGNTVTWTGKTVNVAGLVRWNTDSKDLTNNLTCIGGQTEINISNEHHTVTSGTQLYVLSDSNAGRGNKNTHIYSTTSAGVILPMVVANPGAVALIEGVDYVVYNNNSSTGFIYFPTPPSVLYTDLYFTYTYKFSAAEGASDSNTDSITAYIKRSKTSTKRNIISPTDITSYLATILGGFKDPITDVSLESRDTLITPMVGSKASVYDGIVGRVLIATGIPAPIITQVTKQWPLPITSVSISTKPLKYENESQTTYDTVKKLDTELTATNAKPLFKLDGSTPIQGDVTFGRKPDGTVPELKTPVIHKLTTEPVALTEGQLYYNTTTHDLWVWNNSAWTTFTPAGGSVGGSGTINYLPKWSASQTLTNSVLSESIGNIITGGHIKPSGAAGADLGDATNYFRDVYAQTVGKESTDYIDFTESSMIRFYMNSALTLTFNDASIGTVVAINNIPTTSSVMPERTWMFGVDTYKYTYGGYLSSTAMNGETKRVFGVACELDSLYNVGSFGGGGNEISPWGHVVGLFGAVKSGNSATNPSIWGLNTVVENRAGFTHFMQGYECDVNVMFSPLPSVYNAVGISIASGGTYGGGCGLSVSCSNPNGTPNNRWAIGISLPDLYTICAISIKDSQSILWGTSYISATGSSIYFQSTGGYTYLSTSNGTMHLLPATGANLILQTNGDLYLKNSANSRYLLLQTGATPVSRLIVADTYLDATVSVFFRNTISLANNAYGGSACYITNGVTGLMELHTVSKLKVVVT
jgi:hypothetical protein